MEEIEVSPPPSSTHETRVTRKRTRELKSLGIVDPLSVNSEEIANIAKEIKCINSILSDLETRLLEQDTHLTNVRHGFDDFRRELVYMGNKLKRVSEDNSQDIAKIRSDLCNSSGTASCQIALHSDVTELIDKKFTELKNEIASLIAEQMSKKEKADYDFVEATKKGIIVTMDAKFQEQASHITRVEVSGTAQLSLMKEAVSKKIGDVYTELSGKIDRSQAETIDRIGKDINPFKDQVRESIKNLNADIVVLSNADQDMMNRLGVSYTKTNMDINALNQRVDGIVTNMNAQVSHQPANGNYFLS